ncbi:hypothetical protein A0H81_10324 [Grifola frondosa]|uniref:Uncharacterized protein n=1 Tax=Grifola frondosa TaxID=5627 RepID=A0A1C7LYM4_GRIFR|nr:hypothetical protein A0H81_10324 [Grifola frondosa]
MPISPGALGSNHITEEAARRPKHNLLPIVFMSDEVKPDSTPVTSTTNSDGEGSEDPVSPMTQAEAEAQVVEDQAEFFGI